MMNKIKFRVWDKVIKVMREVLSIDFEKQEVICPPRGHEFSEWYNQHLSFSEVLILQNTGLKDKNGKEIYEGDIVRIKGHALQRDKRGIGIDIDGNYVVKWSEKMELLLSVSLEDDDGWLLNRNVHYTEVIGNIFEHPHLIGGKHG